MFTECSQLGRWQVFAGWSAGLQRGLYQTSRPRLPEVRVLLFTGGRSMLAMADYWREHFLSTVTGMAEIRDIGRSFSYLAGHVSSGDKFVRAWFSQGWVFLGWVGVSLRYRRDFEVYPVSEDLVALSKMDRRVREGELEWFINTGYLSSFYRSF